MWTSHQCSVLRQRPSKIEAGVINEDTTRHVLTGARGHLQQQWISYVTLTTCTTLINPHSTGHGHHFGYFATRPFICPCVKWSNFYTSNFTDLYTSDEETC